MHLQRLNLLSRCIYKKIHYLTFDLGVKVTLKIAQYPVHHVIYASAKFEGATTNDLGEDTITRNMMDGQTYRQTKDRLWYEINTPYFFLQKIAIFNMQAMKPKLFVTVLYIFV